jgi:ABC-type polysaccharide/polyol phosphate transport system ATPase subunit
MPLAIKVENLSKQYRLGQIGTGTLSHDLNRFWASIRGKEDPYSQIGSANDRTQKAVSDYVWALKDINFEIEQGDAVGIIGRNGAGKSTLLKILSRTTLPTTGSVKMKGRIASLLEVGTGFHPEMTGRENIYQNGAILGMTRHEITRKFDEIVDFSGCEAYIDTPVKRYSSGMYVRLAFAVAAHLESEILIVDEVLAVGDAEFQKKCLGKMNDVAKGEGRTVLFVSHNMGAVKSLCNKGMLLNLGTNSLLSDSKDAIMLYTKVSTLNSSFDTTNYQKRTRGLQEIIVAKIELNEVTYKASSPFNIKIELAKIKLDFQYRIELAVFIFDSLENTVYQLSTLFFNQECYFSENTQFLFSLERLRLSEGHYRIGVWLSGNGIEQDYVDENIGFEVMKDSVYENETATIVSIVQRDFEFKTIEK